MQYAALLVALPLLLGLPQGPGPDGPKENEKPPVASDATALHELGPATFVELGGFIRPSADELSFEDIGWRNAFWPAVEEARALGRPILLWTMNGHPLGCT